MSQNKEAFGSPVKSVMNKDKSNVKLFETAQEKRFKKFGSNDKSIK